MCFWRRRKKKVKEEKPVKQEQEVKEEPKEAQAAEPVKEEPKPAPAKKEEPEEEREVKDIYHISQNKDKKSQYNGMWRVRKQGSNKTIKHFETQLEAIDFAKDLAEKADGHIVIHKRDGSIRRQNYN